MKKITLYIIMGLIFVSFAFAATGEANFTNNQREEYLNLTSGVNLSRTLSIFNFAYASGFSATLNTPDLKTVGWWTMDANKTSLSYINDSWNDNDGLVYNFYNSTCFQEQANETSSCGGLNTGKYAEISGFQPSYPGRNAFDGDYSTYAKVLASTDAIIEYNYTKPTFANGAILKISHSNVTSGTTTNYSMTIPSICFSQTKIWVRTFDYSSVSGLNIFNVSCYNGAQFQTIQYHYQPSSGMEIKFYEEAINWTYPAPSFTTGVYGEALSFDGVDDYVNSTKAIRIENTTYISFWLNPSVISQTVVFANDTTPTYNAIGYTNDGELYIETATNSDICYTNPNAVTTGWHYYGLNVLNGSCNFQKDTINLTMPDTSISNYTVFNLIGGGITSKYLTGSIDDLMIFNSSLTDKQITYLYTHQIDKYYTKNLTIYIGNNITYSKVENFNGSLDLSDNNKTRINNNLFSKCSCAGCVIASSYCQLPFYFSSKNDGYLQYSNFYVNYSYGLDNCSNSFNIPTNATAYNFTWRNTLGALTAINFTINANYGFNKAYSFYGVGTQVSNYLVCSYPAWANFTGDITSQYIYASTVYNYNVGDAIFDIITENVNFTVETIATDVTATVYNEINNVVEGAYIYVQKYDATTGNYILVGVYSTNFEGQTKMPLILNSQFYKFLIYYPSSKLLKTTNPTYIYSTSINFQIQTGGAVLDDFYTAASIFANVSFNNATENFNYIFNDPNLEITQACLKIYTNNANPTLYSTSCLSSTSGTILIHVTNATSCYIAKGYVTLNGVEQIMDSESFCYFSTTQKNFKMMALLVDLILTICFAFIFTFSIPFGVIALPIPTLLLSTVGFLPLDPVIAIGIEIAALVVAFIIGDRG